MILIKQNIQKFQEFSKDTPPVKNGGYVNKNDGG